MPANDEFGGMLGKGSCPISRYYLCICL